MGCCACVRILFVHFFVFYFPLNVCFGWLLWLWLWTEYATELKKDRAGGCHIILTSGDTVRAWAECRARNSLCQHRQSRMKSLSCTKLQIDLGLSSPAPPTLPCSLYESRLVKDCCNRNDTDNKNKEQLPIKTQKKSKQNRCVTSVEQTTCDRCIYYIHTLKTHSKQCTPDEWSLENSRRAMKIK